MNTENDLKWANEQITKIPKDKLVQRSIDSLAIAAILLSHRADLDVDDGYGATALYEAIYLKKADLAKLLLRFNAKVNSKTGVYIDGTGDVTPLHRAFWSVELTQLLLERGADAGAKDKTGRTPLDWVRDPAVARVYDRR